MHCYWISIVLGLRITPVVFLGKSSVLPRFCEQAGVHDFKPVVLLSSFYHVAPAWAYSYILIYYCALFFFDKMLL